MPSRILVPIASSLETGWPRPGWSADHGTDSQL